MCISAQSLREYVIRPTLTNLGIWDLSLETLLLGTAATHSQLGQILCSPQIEALGLYGLTAKAHWLLWDTYLVNNPDLASKIRGLASQHQFLQKPDYELITNLTYASAVAGVWYLSKSIKRDGNYTLDSLADLWYDAYYIPQYSRIPQEFALTRLNFIESYNRFVTRPTKSLAA